MIRKYPQQRRSNPSDMIYGTRAVIEAIKADKQIDKIFIQKNVKNELTNELIKLLIENGIVFQNVPGEKLDRLTGKNHQGVIAFVSPIEFADLHRVVSFIFDQGKDGLIVLIDRVTDVRNFGAIVRTAESAGADTIVIPSKGSAQIGSDAVKTSAGALNHLPICKVNDFEESVKYLKESGFHVVACTEKTDQLYSDADLTGPVALIMGSEEDGISDSVLEMADTKVKIPMQGKIESLNVSVAAGIFLFEVVRQRMAALK
ncbi:MULTISPECIES: 23S rRNA (guanosine(2251)-2'-O)-methyltransferase RlmB [unclassified Imperialibacter]|uniref:23S rRNA (guanosine(2251)-2'-O)-methyltransferase RlmB n=1 Tax=unclassified Imperialibacter TaxID=2629706 RepID=UPI0019B1CF7D|nr:conserved hypothetical protein [Imperialibacter sp. 75]